LQRAALRPLPRSGLRARRVRRHARAGRGRHAPLRGACARTPSL